MGRYRFGTFDFDSDTTELRRDGSPVKLQGQPAQVLALLVEHAGELVTRETLQQTVWADGTQVDFERGLNYCIAQVRSALGDSADSPRFIRTVPKKGYQFIAPVEHFADPAQPVQDHSPESPPPVRRPPMPLLIWSAVAVALVAAAASWLWISKQAPRPVIAICLFDNETGDPSADRIASGFSDAITAELASAGNASRAQVIGNAAILRKPRSERNLNQIQEALGANYVIIGQLQKDSTQFRVLAHLLRMPRQTHVTVQRLDMADLETPLETEAEFARSATSRFLRAIENPSSAARTR